MAKAIVWVKDVPSKGKMVVYTTRPQNIVAPKLYREANRKAVTALFVGKYNYLLDDLNTKGVAYLGRKNGLRSKIRSIVQGAAKPGSEVNKVQTAPTEQEQAPKPGTKAANDEAYQRKLKALEKARAARSRKAAERKTATPESDNTVLVLDHADNAPAPRRSLSGQHLTIYMQMVEAELLGEAERFFNKFAS